MNDTTTGTGSGLSSARKRLSIAMVPLLLLFAGPWAEAGPKAADDAAIRAGWIGTWQGTGAFESDVVEGSDCEQVELTLASSDYDVLAVCHGRRFRYWLSGLALADGAISKDGVAIGTYSAERLSFAVDDAAQGESYRLELRRGADGSVDQSDRYEMEGLADSLTSTLKKRFF